MSQFREPSHDPFKPFKVLFFPSEKNSDILTTSFKAGLLILLVASISLVVYTGFTSPGRWSRCPECDGPTRNSFEICEAQDISADNPGPTNISHIVFGIGGSSNTWKHRMHYSKLWWQPNSTRGFVWLDEEPGPNPTWLENSPPCRVSSNWTRFKYTHSDSAVRIARVVTDSFLVGFPNARWFVMGDDDTVFFTENLVTVLSRYDHRGMHYIGGNSESVEQNVIHSYGMAFGGGGFAISYPLAAELVKLMDGCLDRYFYFYGSDQRVWACVNEIGVSLTRERGFHQIDVRGDLYGLLAAHPKAPLVSLHHLDHVKPLFPNQTQHQSLRSLMEAYRFDPSRTMQQCFCYFQKHGWLTSIFWSVSISWGYTVQIYPSMLTASDLEMPLQTFQTWRSWSNGPFTFNTRPVGPDPCKQPVVFFLDAVKKVGKGKTLTSYKKFIIEPKKKCGKKYHALVAAVDRVMVVAPRMDPKEWNKGPRRQCCDVGSLNSGSLKVKIRSCKQGETVAP